MMAATPVILDMDPGHDDAVALVLACAASELEVRAVTTVAGNVRLEKATKNALGVLSLIGRGGVPVGAGAEAPLAGPLHHSAQNVHGESGLGTLQWEEPPLKPDERGALKLMADIVEASTQPLTVVPTGPLTNIAIFLEGQPHLKDNIERIVLMGGSVGLGNATPAAEFNIYVDPEAARVVFESGLPITMVGLEAGRKAALGPEEIEHLRSLGWLGNVTADILTSYAGLYKKVTGKCAPPLYDAVAVAAVVEPEILEKRSMRVEIECKGEFTHGETVCDLRGVWKKPANAEVTLDLDKPAFFEILQRSLKESSG